MDGYVMGNIAIGSYGRMCLTRRCGTSDALPITKSVSELKRKMGLFSMESAVAPKIIPFEGYRAASVGIVPIEKTLEMPDDWNLYPVRS